MKKGRGRSKKGSKFFTERADQSEVKARIVTKYFLAWARIVVATQVRAGQKECKIVYVDLFAGPGRYEDGSASTPLMVLAEAHKIPELRSSLVALFNDYDKNHTRTLEREIAKLPGISDFKYPPDINTGEVDGSAVDYFDKIKLAPTFSFIDPFGYTGLSWALVRAIIKDWASESVFFFNYPRINAGIENKSVFKHMTALFGDERFEALRAELKGQPPHRREQIIMAQLVEAMKEAGANFVLTFRFRSETGSRTTHYIVFVTKHQKGYELMKEIMAGESSHGEQGVPSLEYAPRLKGTRKLFEYAMDELEDRLTKEFAGRSLSTVDIYHEHNVGTSYVKGNYKTALSNLLKANRITTDRVPRVGSFADDIRVTFPKKPIPRK